MIKASIENCLLLLNADVYWPSSSTELCFCCSAPLEVMCCLEKMVQMRKIEMLLRHSQGFVIRLKELCYKCLQVCRY